jgi:hypothetical protein
MTTEKELARRQKEAISQFIGTLEYDVILDHNQLDQDLAEILDQLREGSRT